MSKKRRSHTKSLKTEIAIAAIKEKQSLAQLASKYGIHPSQIKDWKRMALKAIQDIFSNNSKKKQVHEDELLSLIGKLTIENNFLKKNSPNEFARKNRQC